MIPAILFAVFFFVSLLLFLYSLDLFLFLQKENRFYEKEKNDPSYQAALNRKIKQKKHPQKKNYLLFLYCNSLQECGESDRAKALLSMIRPDPILGIKKREAK